MTPDEKAIWVAVFSGEVVKGRLADGGYPVDQAVAAADFAVADLARYRKTQEEARRLSDEALEVATRPDPLHFEKGKSRR